MSTLTHLGQFWCARRREVRLIVCVDDTAFDVTDVAPLAGARRSFRDSSAGADWPAVRWTYSTLPFPSVELVEALEASGRRVDEWARELDLSSLLPIELASLDQDPVAGVDHLVAPIFPRRAQAFGVTYLNSALERETEGQRGDYGFVYRSVKERGERPELFIKGTSPEHFVGPRGRMGLRSDLTNSTDMQGGATERVAVSAGIEPELAAVVYSSGEIWGYTLANDVSGNRIENETLLYLYQAKHFTGALVLGPLILLSREQDNPNLKITTRIFGGDGSTLFERSSNSANINAPIRSLIASAAGHIRLTPGEVFSTGTDVVPDGSVKVLAEGMRVEIGAEEIGLLRHYTGSIGSESSPGPDGAGRDLNLDYSHLEFEGTRDGR